MLSHLILILAARWYDNHYAAGWSWATTTPFQWMKQIASHFGGTRDGFVVAWPGHTAQSEVVRQQFSHVNDVAPTIYAAAGIDFPNRGQRREADAAGRPQLSAAFTDPRRRPVTTSSISKFSAIAPSTRMAGSPARGATRRGKSSPIPRGFRGNSKRPLGTLPRLGRLQRGPRPGGAKPSKLAELKAEFDREATRNGVYPLVPLPVDYPSVVAGKNSFRSGEG